VSLAIRYRGPARPVVASLDRPPVDFEDALEELADAGAGAVVALGDDYALELEGRCLVELARACRALLAAAAMGPDDEARLRAELPELPADAALHLWLFPCFMTWLPSLVFATRGEAETWIYARTLAEEEGLPFVVVEGRDRVEPERVPTAAVRDAAGAFLDAVRADVEAAFPALGL